MQEQSTIFNEDFNVGDYIRRRALLSKGYRIYTWVLIILGLLLFLLGIALAVAEISMLIPAILPHENPNNYPIPSPDYYMHIRMAVLVLLPGLVLTSQSWLVWKEFKWAIWYNRASALFWGLLFMRNYSSTDHTSLLLLIPIAILIPYWAMLFRFQKVWEKKAMGKKDYQQATSNLQ